MSFRLARHSCFLLFATFLFLSSSAHAENMSLPAVGNWNGFLAQSNVIECGNGGNAVDVRITVRDLAGATLGVAPLHLAAQGTQHLILDTFPIANKYGTYTVEFVGGDGSKLRCISVYYRASRPKSAEPFEYVFAIPVENATQGELSGIFNSLDALAGPKPVYNWLSIVNQSNRAFSGTVYVYNWDGSLDPTRTKRVLDLKVGGRQDLPLGQILA